jgi:hypothetical protein
MKKNLPLPFFFPPNHLLLVSKIDNRILHHFQIVLICTWFNMFFSYVGISTMCFFLWEQLTNSFIRWRSNVILKQSIQCTTRIYSRSGLPLTSWTIVGTWIIPRTTFYHPKSSSKRGILNLDSKKPFWILPMHMLNGKKKRREGST